MFASFSAIPLIALHADLPVLVAKKMFMVRWSELLALRTICFHDVDNWEEEDGCRAVVHVDPLEEAESQRAGRLVRGLVEVNCVFT